MRWFAKAGMAAALAIAGAYGAACVSSTESTSGDALDPSVADVVLEGNATGKAAVSLLAATPISGAALRPRIVSPPPDTVALASQVVTFSWEPGGSTARHVPPTPRLLPEERPLVPAWLTELLGPERAAAAAPSALRGTGYFLLFSTDEAPRLLRVFTTDTSYTPDKKAWDTLVSAGMWTKLTLVSAMFSGDAVLPATGPFVADPIEFCIEGG
jgi:hypothetical protein